VIISGIGITVPRLVSLAGLLWFQPDPCQNALRLRTDGYVIDFGRINLPDYPISKGMNLEIDSLLD